MIEVLKYSLKQKEKNEIPMISFINQETYFSDFYHFTEERIQKLEIEETKEVIHYNEEDQFYVKYFP